MNSMSRRSFLKIGALLGMGLTGGALAGCSQGASPGAASRGAATTAQASSEGTGKTLVAYYSAQGHTKRVAEAVADELGADLFEIVPEQVYTDADLTWTNEDSRVSREHDDESLRDVPLAQTTPDAWADYNTVLFGYPIWWAIATWPCDHFATDNDFTGKRVVPFCTSSSSDLGQSGELLAQAAGTGSWERGQRFSSGASDDEVRSWARGL